MQAVKEVEELQKMVDAALDARLEKKAPKAKHEVAKKEFAAAATRLTTAKVCLQPPGTSSPPSSDHNMQCILPK